MAAGVFITGTDTNVGKTWSSIALLLALRAKGYTTAGFKPVAAGCPWDGGGWKNRDALLLQRFGTAALDYQKVNPYAFELAVSPHIACGTTPVNLQVLQSCYAELAGRVDWVVVEGAGGWLSPLGAALDNAELALALQLPVILVVGMRLGCINHACLSAQAVKLANLRLAGWIAVTLDVDMPAFNANLEYLQSRLDAPLLGVLPHQRTANFGELAEHLSLTDIIY